MVQDVSLTPGDRCRLKGTEIQYQITAIRSNYFNQPERSEIWATLISPTGTIAHWPINQLEKT